MDVPQTKHILIVGGGVIGSTTAYYLTRHPNFDPSKHTITLLEATSIAAGASGRAGGLLALWAYPECLVPLSYRLHRELAEEHGGAEKWGYRRVKCGTIGAVVRPADLEEARKAAQGASTDTPTLTQVETAAPPASEPEGASRETNGDTKGAASEPSLVSATAASSIASRPDQSEVKIESGTQAGPGEERPAAAREGKEWEKLPKQDAAATSLLSDSALPPDLDWIDPKLVQYYEEMGRRGFTETAQVHPFHFTTAIADLARAAGVDIRLGAKFTGVKPAEPASSSPSPGLLSVEYEDRAHGEAIRTVDGVTDVIVAAGPWTGGLLPRSKVEGLRAHSIVFEADVTPYAVFTDIQLPADYVPEHRARAGQKRKHKGNVDPEVYARPFGEVYACGEPDKTIPLPSTADQVQTDQAQCDDLAAYLATISPTLAAAPIRARQACYLPQHVRFGTERGPLVGPTSTPGVWVASGHTCWGIQNGPATGYLMAEWVLDGAARAADIDVLHPAKFKV
ncbi:FAD dependent oxidoreductase [Cryphonectria parasitica EP155]|uniref:FAD dependent oxidoreductase n=1 Tax=Cryphonectria parasitica (strain ATCC 38755 / EP155) TaxID=660469 RepID=A0A9P4YC52_CRYP1|nr:FAD dependent oxidoreductase [Cryphonectria parasitica EP155]KAF3770829.1 FAD dependent oxidoreductase [Cryphonectria parasitica EP155]